MPRSSFVICLTFTRKLAKVKKAKSKKNKKFNSRRNLTLEAYWGVEGVDQT
jgi:hypothetical protein